MRDFFSAGEVGYLAEGNFFQAGDGKGMIEDFNALEDGVCIAADVCIIGAGAAGVTLAREFLGTRFCVVLLESGGLEKEAAMQTLNEGEVAGRRHTGAWKREECAGLAGR